jgi:hypothetical protein
MTWERHGHPRRFRLSMNPGTRGAFFGVRLVDGGLKLSLGLGR